MCESLVNEGTLQVSGVQLWSLKANTSDFSVPFDYGFEAAMMY
jgi:hypothetical protein